MPNDIKDKVIVVTGGATGIGYEIADNFLKKGAKVIIILDINEKDGKEAVQTFESKYGKSKAVFYKCDVSKDLEEVSKIIFDTYESVDVLVNNAGIGDETHVKKLMDINATAVIEWSYKFLEHMSKRKEGTIINIASIYGFRIDYYCPVYKASKFAVLGFTKSLGHKYNFDKSGVRIVAVCPGYTETNLTAGIKIDFDAVWQKAEDVGKAVIDVYERAESGTAWLIEGGNPIVQVP